MCKRLLLFIVLVSSIVSVKNVEVHGPTLSTVSIAAARMHVSTMSIELGIVIVPVVDPLWTFGIISILPSFPFF